MRLSVITTAGPVDSIAVLAAGNADLAVARTDEEMPDGTESVAILRKNVVVLWAASGLSAKGARASRPNRRSRRSATCPAIASAWSDGPR